MINVFMISRFRKTHLNFSKSGKDEEDGTSPVNITFDAAWQKRECGRSDTYNSRSGK